MDPTVCMKHLLEAIEDGDRDVTIAVMTDLLEWLRKGGAMPCQGPDKPSLQCELPEMVRMGLAMIGCKPSDAMPADIAGYPELLPPIASRRVE